MVDAQLQGSAVPPVSNLEAVRHYLRAQQPWISIPNVKTKNASAKSGTEYPLWWALSYRNVAAGEVELLVSQLLRVFAPFST